MGSTLKGIIKLLRGANSFLLEMTPFRRDANNLNRVISLESVSIPLELLLLTGVPNAGSLTGPSCPSAVIPCIMTPYLTSSCRPVRTTDVCVAGTISSE